MRRMGDKGLRRKKGRERDNRGGEVERQVREGEG